MLVVEVILIIDTVVVVKVIPTVDPMVVVVEVILTVDPVVLVVIRVVLTTELTVVMSEAVVALVTFIIGDVAFSPASCQSSHILVPQH